MFQNLGRSEPKILSPQRVATAVGLRLDCLSDSELFLSPQRGFFMNKTVLLAATAVLALTAGSAFAASHPTVAAKATNAHAIHSPGKALYNQNSNFGYGLVSQNFTSGSFGTVYNAAAADDFAVPAGKTWKVKGVDVTGVYFNGYGPATSELITFYKNSKGHPGKVVGKAQTLNCADSAGSFACTLSSTVKLNNSAGTKKAVYWVSVVVNMPFVTGQGEWGWVQNTTIQGTEGNWENPGNGFGTGCTTWGPNSQCLGLAGDYAFDLKGKSL
jgi:hypothetical protein